MIHKYPHCIFAFFYLLLLRFEFFKENMNSTRGFLICKWCLWNATYTNLLPIRGIYIHEFTYILIIILYLNLNILNSLKLTILSLSSIIQLTNGIFSSHYDNIFINELMGDLFPLSSTKNIQYLYHNFTTRYSHLPLISFPSILQVKKKLRINHRCDKYRKSTRRDIKEAIKVSLNIDKINI